MDKKEKKKEKLFKKQMPSEKNVKKENVQSTDNVEVLEEEHFKKEQTESTFDEDKYKQEITKLTDENKKFFCLMIASTFLVGGIGYFSDIYLPFIILCYTISAKGRYWNENNNY